LTGGSLDLKLFTMEYYSDKIVKGNFNDILQAVKASLKKEDFELFYEIDMQEKVRLKLGSICPGFVVLGACNMDFLYNVLDIKGEITASLPFNFVLQQINENEVKIIVIDPFFSIKDSNNEFLVILTYAIKLKLARMMESITTSYDSKFLRR
jgi:uncharacterized protein (DUF302 family)